MQNIQNLLVEKCTVVEYHDEKTFFKGAGPCTFVNITQYVNLVEKNLLIVTIAKNTETWYNLNIPFVNLFFCFLHFTKNDNRKILYNQ